MSHDWVKMGYGNTPALSKTFVLECTWTDCPVEVQDEIHELWIANEYGNDDYYHSWDWEGDGENYPITLAYLTKRIGIIGDPVLIHLWW